MDRLCFSAEWTQTEKGDSAESFSSSSLIHGGNRVWGSLTTLSLEGLSGE
ncbi:hypothetical protein E2C01_078756 [Portunus trituberculatus]|uniref:Uncharacterized protein n=1 Tax=Portunus trituberculatus TaxID=210409 RepID=A0A5B7IJN4_PORTR|nr:hypothetical protein [Portunus trituberculatus]